MMILEFVSGFGGGLRLCRFGAGNDIYRTMTGSLANLLGNGTAADPAGRHFISRDLPSAALSLLMSQVRSYSPDSSQHTLYYRYAFIYLFT